MPMPKDQLAQGAKSARFSAGQAKKDDPIQFHGTVAVEEDVPELVSNFHQERDSDESWQGSEALYKLVRAKDISRKYKPLNDRVLVRRIIEDSGSLIQQPDAFKRKPTKGEVLAVGTGMVIGGQLIAIPLEVGDTIHFGEHGVEDVELEGETLALVSAFDVRLRVLA